MTLKTVILNELFIILQMVILSDPGGGKGGDHLRKKRNNDRQYVFDVAFGADSSQQEVYEKTTKPLVRKSFYNFAIFCGTKPNIC